MGIWFNPVWNTTWGLKKPLGLVSPLFSARKPAEKPLTKPPALNPGDTIALVAPATAVSKRELRDLKASIKKQGFQVVSYASTDQYDKHYLSDSDKGRAKAINKAFANPDVKAVFSVQGGGGTYRPDFLNHLDWKLIRRNPKIFTGFSDITFLHLAFRKMAGLVTFHTGAPYKGKRNADNTQALWKMIAPKKTDKLPAPIQAGAKYTCLVPGTVKGELVGGNLSLLSSAIGTPYEPDLTGKILLLEDWKEPFETVDRLFAQLLHRGMLDKIKGLVLGEFLYVPVHADDYGLPWRRFVKSMGMSDLVKEAKKRGIPVGYNFPVGHGYRNRPVPLGIQVQFDSKAGTLRFLESPVSPGKGENSKSKTPRH